MDLEVRLYSDAGSCNRARIRVIATCTPADRSVPVRNLVTLLGGIIALVTALSIPVGYGIIGYFKEANALTYKAELSAARAAQYIYAPDAPWKYDTDQLAPEAFTNSKLIVQRRSPEFSRPPSNYERVYHGRWYDVWQRSGPAPPCR